jgi:DNA/RNA-binding domain of Phe-tRNA-synthetase-like protein
VNDAPELVAATGSVEGSVQAEFPGLGLRWVTLSVRSQPAPREVKLRLRGLSNRYRGASVVAMRTQPIPHAYRAFFRQVGLDPDATRIPSEEAAVARLLHGGFRSQDLLSDALLIALVETGVPVWALDADQLDGTGLGIRTTIAGEKFGAGEYRLPEGQLAVADSQQVHALLFGAIAPGHDVGGRTKRVALFAVGVDGVPEIHVEEALWVCGEVLSSG